MNDFCYIFIVVSLLGGRNILFLFWLYGTREEKNKIHCSEQNATILPQFQLIPSHLIAIYFQCTNNRHLQYERRCQKKIKIANATSPFLYTRAVACFIHHMSCSHGQFLDFFDLLPWTSCYEIAALQRENSDTALFQKDLLTEPDQVPRISPKILISGKNNMHFSLLTLTFSIDESNQLLMDLVGFHLDIVLRQPPLSIPFQMCLDCNSQMRKTVLR